MRLQNERKEFSPAMLGFAAINVLECILVSSTTLLLAPIFAKIAKSKDVFEASGSLSLCQLSTVFALALGTLWAFVVAILGGFALNRLAPELLAGLSLGAGYMSWLDAGMISIVVPFTVSLVSHIRSPDFSLAGTFAKFKANRLKILIFGVDLAFLVAFSYIFTKFIPFPVASTTIGLYLAGPLICLCGASVGLFGLTCCILAVGLCALGMIPLSNYEILLLTIPWPTMKLQ